MCPSLRARCGHYDTGVDCGHLDPQKHLVTMDRASELRALMKAKSTGGTLTGKDKAKYLKSLREGQKEKSAELKPASVLVPDSSAYVENHKPELKQVRVISIPTLAAPLKVVKLNAIVASKTYPATGVQIERSEKDNIQHVSDSAISSFEPPLGSSDTKPHLNLPAKFFDEESSSVFTSGQGTQQSSDHETNYITSHNYDDAERTLAVKPKQSRSNAADEYTGDMIDLSFQWFSHL